MYIGIDLGTSSTKGILVDEKGKVHNQIDIEYPTHYFNDCWSEQDPKIWLDAVETIIKELTKNNKKILGVSLAGQMHGLVILDENDNVIRPAILWNDGRASEETNYLNQVIGKAEISKYTDNIAYAGFTAPKIIWLKNNEPENFKKIKKIMLPKDYITYKLTGKHVTDFSDASGTLLLDVKNKRWSKKMIEICEIDEKMLPELLESYEIVGKIKKDYNLGDALLVAGAADNAAAALSMGIINENTCNISLGTSGTIFIPQKVFKKSKNNSLHNFLHANGKWCLLGCVLSAASSYKWWVEKIIKTDEYDLSEVDASILKNNKVLFAPYLMGERSPHNDTEVRGAFLGLSFETDQKMMQLSILEGVSFALRDCIEISKETGLNYSKVSLCGGGSKNKLWIKIIANILNLDIYMTEQEIGPAYGAAILAMVGNKKFLSVEEAVSKLIKLKLVEKPDKKLVEYYDKKYKKYHKIYSFIKKI